MLNFSRRDRTADAKEARPAGRPVLKPAIYEPPGSAVAPPPGTSLRSLPPEPAPAGARPDGSAAAGGAEASAVALPPTHAPLAPSDAETTGSKLLVGVNVKLTGVAISACDLLVVEGHVEATVNSKAMQIAKPGTLTGTALVEVAEIHGDFTGELTASTRLVVHGTGRVSGTIRYGRLIVADGGQLTGDLKRLDAADAPLPPQGAVVPRTSEAPARSVTST
jgi:cytoskeletal protein CcmA (bactofilin family)